MEIKKKDNILSEQDKIKQFVKSRTKKTKIKKTKEYSLYKSNEYAKISNAFFEKLAFRLINKYKFESLKKALSLADIKFLLRTYLAMLLFSTLIALPLSFLIAFAFTTKFLVSLLLAIIGSALTFVIFYAYPYSVINQRKRRIKTDLVFATVHMGAIAGSGAPPVRIFTLLLESGEYKGLESEIKKVLNYLNLFGYNLSTALRAVASTTPSNELKELFSGMVSTIETGGDIKKYLQDKASDALVNYRLDQQKYVSTLSTYSDIYTGILVTAPLLFLVVLAILDKISPTISGIGIDLIAAVSTYILLPVINVAFIVFLNITQPEI